MVALGLALLCGLLGVTGNWLYGSAPMLWRIMLGRYLASVIVTIVAFGVGEVYILPRVGGNYLALIGLAGIAGWFIDLVLAITQAQIAKRGGLPSDVND